MNAQLPFTSSGHCAVPAVGAFTRPNGIAWREVLQQVLRAVAVFGLAFLCYLVVTHFLLQTVKVVGSSMSPTLKHSQLYLLNRFVFLLRSPAPSDVVVLRDPADHGFSVKRIVARPGDSVLIREGKLFVNGQELKESYLPQGTPTYPNGTVKQQSFTCAPDQFFVLGDNRLNSADSRTYGPVPKREILGLLVY